MNAEQIAKALYEEHESLASNPFGKPWEQTRELWTAVVASLLQKGVIRSGHEALQPEEGQPEGSNRMRVIDAIEHLGIDCYLMPDQMVTDAMVLARVVSAEEGVPSAFEAWHDKNLDPYIRRGLVSFLDDHELEQVLRGFDEVGMEDDDG